MNLEKWLPMYEAICEEFGFSMEADRASAELLATIIGQRGRTGLEAVRRTIPESVLICGGSPCLSEELALVDASGFVVAADGATSVLSDANIRVDMIVTDLDGIIEDQIECNTRGTVVFLHAHGDNRSAVKRWTGRFEGPLVGTCQCPPPDGVFNFGGFTDGDRAACICVELGARTLRLAGFDFANPSEKTGSSREVKRKKLMWALRIIEGLRAEGVEVVSALDK
jgi:hypothetical protein